MSYQIVSDRKVCNKAKGETLSDKEILDAGVSVEALIAGNHIKSSNTPSIKTATEGATK